MEDLITIIVAIYNVEEYLIDCIDSVINQTYKNIEILLVDDGSTDSSFELCKKYQKKDKRIKIIHKKNGGLSDARNYGISNSHGNYIVFIDGDDMIRPNMIEILYKTCIENKADCACCNSIRCNDNDKYVYTVENRNTITKSKIYFNEDKMYNFLATGEILTSVWAKMYKKSIFNDIKFPYGKYHEDIFVMYLIIDKANTIVSTDYIGYIYRINNKSITNMKFNIKHLDSIDGKFEQLKFIETNYPNLVKYAKADVITACNNALLHISKSYFFDEEVFDTIQKLYRKYYLEYISIKDKSIKNRIFVMVSTINIKFSIFIINNFIYR